MSKKATNPEMNIVFRNPAELRPHELLRDLPMLSESHPDYLALCDEVLRGGSMTPIFITADGRIAEGRHRNRAYKAAQRDVPCIVIPDEEVAHVALKANTLRRHYQKFQIAFGYYPIIAKAVERAKERQRSNLKQGAEHPADGLTEADSPTVGRSVQAGTVEELAGQMGVSRSLLFEAKQTYEALVDFDIHNKPQTWPDSPRKKLTALEYFTGKIMADEDPMRLGFVRSGLAGKATTAEKQRAPKRSLPKILVSAAVTFTNQMSAIGALDELEAEEKKELREYFSRQFLTQRKWGAEECDQAIAGLDALKKEFQLLKKKAGEGTDN